MNGLISSWVNAMKRHNESQQKYLRIKDRVIIDWSHGWMGKPLIWLQPQGEYVTEGTGRKERKRFICALDKPFDVHVGWSDTWRVDPITDTMVYGKDYIRNTWIYRRVFPRGFSIYFRYADTYNWGLWVVSDGTLTMEPKEGMTIRGEKLVPGTAPHVKDHVKSERLDLVARNAWRRIQKYIRPYEVLRESVTDGHPMHYNTLHNAHGYGARHLRKETVEWLCSDEPTYNYNAHVYMVLNRWLDPRWLQYHKREFKRTIYAERG